ncbi:MAG: hypothetical protein CL675_07600 [Bdellovibrionaceae bacterium]|nr:hypothetical protein [Pseudobdellovibrionaceae bacterium]
MSWTSESFKALRYRLGWSAAQMGSRFGLSVDQVLGIEKGLRKIPQDARLQLDYLYCQLEQQGQVVQENPRDEFRMDKDSISQLKREPSA